MSDGTIAEENTIGRFQKNANASIQVSLVTWEGNNYLDVREVVPSDKPDQAFIFTKKGIRFHADMLGQLIELLQKAAK